MRSLGKNRTDRDGLKQGYWVIYWANNMCEKGSYKNGLRYGIWDLYSEGDLITSVLYENGILIKEL